MKRDESPEASFIVPARNEADFLPSTLRSIRDLETERSYEVIVVDGGSDDATVEIARSFGATVLRQDGRGIGSARHQGAERAAGEWFAFVDADTAAVPRYLELLAGIAPLVDRRAGLSLVALAGYTYAIEFVGVTTGRPYGAFEYGIELGPMLFGAVPLALPLFFVPLALNAYLLCLLLLGPVADRRRYRLPPAVAATVTIDLVLDPAAVALGFWSYAGGGAYYGVPLSNFAGWGLSATVAVAAIDAGFDRRALRERLERCEFALDDLASFLILWGLVNVAVGNWIPAGVVGAFAAAMLATGRIDASAEIAKYDPRLGR